MIEDRALRLADSVQGFTEADLWAFLKLQNDQDPAVLAQREAGRAVLQEMVVDGRLRREGTRFWKGRAAA